MTAMVVFVLCTVALAGVMGAAVCPAELDRAVRRLRRRLAPPPPPSSPSVASAPAIEELAADVRRVRRVALAPAPGTPMARRRGILAAYDDLLAQAARTLEVPDLMSELPEGTERDAERLRLEHLLREAGLVLDQSRTDLR
ncbi:hypothetical protein [Nocardioides sp. zg-1228]|uniref:hypothetical protein n=1 Tax=Nocardioides sp. zg-1228 TaxID=2763008 RepID=UPI00164333D2|nr:hypothetical protein [Nocardioides sp. zg-1228]MBC2934881.1 hypothetical protein [Nocardioides sp. zg-1228]QSF58329.1 hypothetical protein JX575_03760 [Nocardioides sp. zg-1228]